jgi:hypothetical protein
MQSSAPMPPEMAEMSAAAAAKASSVHQEIHDESPTALPGSLIAATSASCYIRAGEGLTLTRNMFDSSVGWWKAIRPCPAGSYGAAADVFFSLGLHEVPCTQCGFGLSSPEAQAVWSSAGTEAAMATGKHGGLTIRRCSWEQVDAQQQHTLYNATRAYCSVLSDRVRITRRLHASMQCDPFCIYMPRSNYMTSAPSDGVGAWCVDCRDVAAIPAQPGSRQQQAACYLQGWASSAHKLQCNFNSNLTQH